MRAEIDLRIPFEVKLLTRYPPPGWEDQVREAIDRRFADELRYRLIPVKNLEREGYGIFPIQPLEDGFEPVRDPFTGEPYGDQYSGVLSWSGAVESPELDVIASKILYRRLVTSTECCSIIVLLGEPELRVTGNYGIEGLVPPYGWERVRGESSNGFVAAVTRGQITVRDV